MKLFLDLEMLSYDTNSVIAIGLTSLNGKINYQTTIHPGYERFKVTKLINNLTGITNEQLDNSPIFPEVFNKLVEKFKTQLNSTDGVTFYTWGENDLIVWNNVCRRYKLQNQFQMINYQKVLMGECKLKKQPSLLKTIELVNKTYRLEHHNPLDDAKMLKSIYKKYKRFPNEVRLVLRRAEYEKDLYRLQQRFKDVVDYQLEELMM
ncbi:exonuclease domain-containing protein [Neobacillus sp. LXY-4]|uniref:exonuclease domain-containing protein n=1 Tax=Neobacillus sp. LXY-4 TaxID=3379826 RepID=UPI003EE2AD06